MKKKLNKIKENSFTFEITSIVSLNVWQGLIEFFAKKSSTNLIPIL